MQNQFYRSFLLLFTLLFVFILPARAAFTSMVVIGDSLSDQGNVFDFTSALPPSFLTPPLEYTDGTNFGRFTNGLNYIDYLSSSLNLSVTPSRLGGSNYAYGGALTNTDQLGIPSLSSQLGTYFSDLGSSVVDPGALHVVYGGSNDLLDIFDLALANPTYDPIPAVESTVASIFGILDQLATADAKSILVPNVANLGLVPLITQGGAPVDEATMLSLLFNTGLSTAVDDLATLYPDTRFFEFDVFGLFTDAYLNPTDYGFSNVSDACYSLFVEAGGTTCSSPDEFISWDGLHPTTAAHEIFAANVVVPIPAALWLFGSGLLGLLVVVRRRS